MLTCPNCRSENEDDSVTCFTCGSSLGSTAAIRRGSIISNRYEIQEPLGKGGMGMVYKAHDRDLDETVALKLLRADIAADPEMQKRFRSEIKLARKVRHRNVCGINEYGQDGNLRYIAMEYLEGVDLRHVLQRKGAPLPEEAFEISIQVGQGLQAIHDAGIVHRDLKTPNIMRDKVGHVRLMDFGIAKQIGAEATMGATQMGMIVGTPEYMSPEQARGEKIDFRSDIYAWGIVTFEIFTGSVPFKGDTPIATIFKHLQEMPPLQGAGLPESLLPVLTKALAKNPADRYNDCNEMVEALQAARAVAFPNWKVAPTGSQRAAGSGPSMTPLPGTTALPTPSPTRIPNQPSTLVKDGATPRPQPQQTVLTPLPIPQASPTVMTKAPSADSQHRQAAVRDLLARAEGLASAQRLDEAHDVLKQAAEIEPGSTLVNRLLAQTAADIKRHQEAQEDARRKEEAQHRAEAERAAERAAAERAEKDRRAQAERRAAAEKAAAAQAAAAQAAVAQADAERKKRDAAERAAAERQAAEQAAAEKAAQKSAEKAAQKAAEAAEKAQKAEKAEATRRAEAERQRQKAEAERAAAEKARADKAADEERRRREAQEQKRQQEAERARQQATLAQAAVPQAALNQSQAPSVSSAAARLPAKGMGWVLPAGGAAVLAVLVVVGVVVSRRGTVEVTPPSTLLPSASPLPPEPSPPTVPGMGVLVLDAVPWAEVVDVVDAKGKHHTPGGSAYTPLTLSLPPGEYTVSLKNPGASQSRSIAARVEAAGTKRLSTEFQKVDVDDYFKKTGW